MRVFDVSENKKFLFASLGLMVFFTLLAGTVFYRVVYFSDTPVTTFAEVLAWQIFSWLPWFAVFSVASLPFGKKVQAGVRNWNLAAHILAAVAVSVAATLWFKLVSENFSPFLGMEETRFGVFRWFFIFWFFLNLFLYWGSVSFFGLAGAVETGRQEKPGKARLVVKSGKVSEVVKPENVVWIEAQDYYSVLHLGDKQSWIKMTMKELEKALDPTTFIRIHRSTIINVNHLKKIKTEASGKYSAVMREGKTRPISRKGWRDLKKVLNPPG